jgi:hypothetical protein
MIDLQQRAMTGTTLTLENSNTKTDQEKPFDIVEQLLTKDLDYTLEEDGEVEPGKDEQELDEDLNSLEPASLELEEMSAMHEELTQLHDSPELEPVSVLALPSRLPIARQLSVALLCAVVGPKIQMRIQLTMRMLVSPMRS